MSSTNSGAAEPRSLETLLVHPGPRPRHGAPLVPPLVQSTTFSQEGFGEAPPHTYSRASNPTVSALEEALGELSRSLPAVACSTGCSALTTLLLTVLETGSEVIVSDVVYGGTSRLLEQVLAPLGIHARFVDTASAAQVEQALTPRTRLILLETPGNPTLRLADLQAVLALGRARGVLTAVDNTFLTAVLQRPLDVGADVELLSTTKFIEGHNATVGGALLTRDARLLERLRRVRKTLGTIQSPFDAWLTLRGLKTLALRLRQQSRNALVLARRLSDDARVRRVYYPGLPSFPQAELARRQHGSGEDAHGAVLSFELGGGLPEVSAFLRALRLCIPAENLGAPETLVTHPCTMTHADVPLERRLRTGITDTLLRVSVGLESVEDVGNDIAQALDVALGKEVRP